MSKLIKNMIWPAIIFGILMAVVYYRAFLFSPEFNNPVDVVINEVSQSLDYKIPEHVLANNEKSVYNKIFDDEYTEAKNNTSYVPEVVVNSNDNLSVDDIALVVKETMNETLEIFKEENKQDINTQTSEAKNVLTESELLFKARLAYWNRDLKTAKDTYLKLTEIAGDPNAYGELGNLYYMQAKWKKASDAYYHAAIKLKSINKLDQAYHLLRIIRGLDTEIANKLQSELQQPG